VDWIEGLAIAVAIAVIVLVSSLSDWRKEKQFQLLNEQREDRMVSAIRNGKQVNINTKVGSALSVLSGCCTNPLTYAKIRSFTHHPSGSRRR
jgi:hypothetical protein